MVALPAPSPRRTVLDRALAMPSDGGQASLNFTGLATRSGFGTATMRLGWRGRL